MQERAGTAGELLLFTLIGSAAPHLFRSQAHATPSWNYTSRQDAGARTRTEASTMATVLSRALKLPGKEWPPLDHPAPTGAGETRRP